MDSLKKPQQNNKKPHFLKPVPVHAAVCDKTSPDLKNQTLQ